MEGILSNLHDSHWVGQFQSYFGIEKVYISEVNPNMPWNPREVPSSINKENIIKNFNDKCLGIKEKTLKGENLILYKVRSINDSPFSFVQTGFLIGPQ